MAVLLIYYVQLLIWVLLIRPALGLRGRARTWVVAVAAAGGLAAAYEAWMVFVWMPSVSAPIRIDIPLISIVLWCLYGSAAVVLFRKKWRKLATTMTAALALLGGAMILVWMMFQSNSERTLEAMHTRNLLVFEAKFRSRDDYEAYFGLADAAPADHPVGHWATQGHAYYSRLIINREGRAWLFYRCGDSECHDGPEGTAVERAADRAGTWRAVLDRGGGKIDLLIAGAPGDGLSVRIDGEAVAFVAAAPPINARPAVEAISFLGPFTQTVCDRGTVLVRQVWLWAEGSRLYALGIFTRQNPGTRADFLTPTLMGEGVREGDRWRFAWGRSSSASIALEGADALLTLSGEGQDADRERLRPGAVFQDWDVALAPLTTKEDWDRWFDVVLIGHFSSGDIPPCPGDA